MRILDETYYNNQSGNPVDSSETNLKEHQFKENISITDLKTNGLSSAVKINAKSSKSRAPKTVSTRRSPSKMDETQGFGLRNTTIFDEICQSYPGKTSADQ
jgi:hypothetical protein